MKSPPKCSQDYIKLLCHSCRSKIGRNLTEKEFEELKSCRCLEKGEDSEFRKERYNILMEGKDERFKI